MLPELTAHNLKIHNVGAGRTKDSMICKKLESIGKIIKDGLI